MPKTQDQPDELTELRQRAEAELGKLHREVPDFSPEEAQRLIHDLHTHQIELEMQNEELRHAQKELAEARDRYLDLYDFAPIGYVTLSGEGLIVEANLTLSEMLGLERRRLIRRPFSQLIDPVDQDLYYRHLHALSEAPDRSRCDLRLLKEGAGSFWAGMEITPVLDANGELAGLRAAIADISERRKYQDARQELSEELERRVAARSAELEEKQAELVQAGKMAALGRLAAGIAHEIGHPLSAISVRLQRLRTRREPEFVDESVILMSNQVERLTRTIRAVSSMVSAARSQRSVFRIDSSLETTVGFLKAESLGERSRIELKSPPSPVHAFADQDCLQQVFLNLGMNALESMAGGGKLTIELAVIDDWACISFTDTGAGMSEETRHRLFEPFYSTKKETHMGLGLALCRELVEAENGRIEVGRAEGKGTVFRVFLPIHESP